MKRFLLKIIAIAAMCCATGAWAAVTHTTESGFNKDGNGCYQINSPEDLYGFADLVNGGKTKICGVVTKNITASDTWTPMMGYSGYFEGNNYTISDLTHTSTSADNVGLFGSVQSGAVIKHVILSNAKIYGDSAVGGIVGNVSGTDVIIDGCGVAGDIKGVVNVGGLVGNVAKESQLAIVNSYNTADVGRNTGNSKGEDLNGLIGYVFDNATVTMINCYDSGMGYTSNLLTFNANAKVNATDVGCIYDRTAYGGASTYASKCSVDGVGNVTSAVATNAIMSGGGTSDAATAITTAFSNNLSSDTYQSEKIDTIYTNSESAVGKMLALRLTSIDASGVTFSNTDNGVVATLSDADGVLSIPQNIKVDSVVLNRTFNTELSTSTVMLPFEIAATNVENAEFYNVTAVTKTGGTAETENQTISAYKPYLVKPTEPAITFKGAVTLQKTSGNEEESYSIGDWSFRGRITNRTWYEEDVDGKAYIYSPKDLSNGLKMGDFAKMGKNVRIKTMRAYLYYTGTSATPLAKAPAAVMMATTEAVTADTLPANIPMTFIHKDIVVQEEGSITSGDVIPSEESSEEDYEEGPTALQTLKVPASMNKADRWYDLKGRRLNKKPAAHGAYVNNNVPVIVK